MSSIARLYVAQTSQVLGLDRECLVPSAEWLVPNWSEEFLVKKLAVCLI